MAENVSLVKTLQENTSNINTTDSKNLYFGISDGAYRGVLSGICVLAGLTVISNVTILIASKYTTAGQSATLVFIRSLCFADVIIGLFGIFKGILLNHLDGVLINCFLPESLFVSASTTLSLAILWLSCDSYWRATRPLSYGASMDKSNIINSIMLLWNFAFILGFMPQMGWSRDDYTCDLFNYYNDVYLLLICSIWIFCMLCSCILQYKLHVVRGKILQNSHFLSPQSQEFKRFSKLIVTIRIDVIIWISTYLPLLMYMLLFCNSCSLGGSEAANANLFFFIPIFLIRSFLSAFIHSYRAIQIQHAVRKFSRSLPGNYKGSLSSVEGATSNDSSNSNQSDQSINTVSQTAAKLGVRHHKPLEATMSNITIESTLEENPKGPNCILSGTTEGHNFSKVTAEHYPKKKALSPDRTNHNHQSDVTNTTSNIPLKLGVQVHCPLSKEEKLQNKTTCDLSHKIKTASNLLPELGTKVHKPVERTNTPLENTHKTLELKSSADMFESNGKDSNISFITINSNSELTTNL